MGQQFHGSQGDLAQSRFAIIVSKYHLSITQKLLDGALQTLKRNQVPDSNVDVLWVPGAWELPAGAQIALNNRKYDAVIVFGCVIRGETTHDQHINTTVSNTLGKISTDHQCPIGFGLLTCNTMDQAIARAGGEVGNKGIESAEAALHMVYLKQEVQVVLDPAP